MPVSPSPESPPADERVPASRRGLRRPDLAVVVGCTAVVAWALVRVWQSSGPGEGFWQDTPGYLDQAAEPLWSLAFWAGPRAPGLPLVVRLAGADPGRVVGIQVALAVVAWAVLALTAGACVRPGWRRVVASGLVLAFASTRPVTQWDRQLLSESLALSTLAFTTAALLWFARRRDGWSGAALVVAAAAWLSVRDTHVVVVALTGVVAVGLAGAGRRRAGARRPSSSVVAMLVVGLVLVGVAVAGRAGADHGRRGVGPVAGVYATRVLPFPDRLGWFAERGLPQVGELRARARAARAATPPDAPVVVAAFPGDDDLSRYLAWLEDHGTSALVRYALAHPGYVVAEPFARPGRDFNDLGRWSNYVAVERDLPLVGRLLFPPWPWVLLGATGAVVVTVRRRRHATTWPVVWWVTAGWGAAGLVHLLAAWHGDAQEVTRHVLVADVQVRLAVLLAVGWAVDALGRPGPVSASGPPASAGPGTGPRGRGRRRSA